MIVVPIAELRQAVIARADELPHPTKDRVAMGLQRERHGDAPLRYGRLVYFEGGNVGARVDGVYLIARGTDHEDSLRQLAYRLGLTNLDLGVTVDEVTADEFRAAQTKQ